MIDADCPALDKNRAGGACTVYKNRPHECRVQGFSFSATESASTEVPYNETYLKEYETEDWETFFASRIPSVTKKGRYSVVVDV